MKDTKSTTIISKMFVSLFAFLVIAAMYLIMAENRSSSDPVIFSLRGSADEDSEPVFRSLREGKIYDDDNDDDKSIIEAMSVTIKAPAVRRFYFNGDNAYCVCDGKKCKEIPKRQEIQKKQEYNKKNETDTGYRYRDHLLFMKTSFRQSGIKEKEKEPDPDDIQNATLYITAIM
jgi:hypothetical protein